MNLVRKNKVIKEVMECNIPCFTIVRNPWERAVSSWKWCMLKKGLPLSEFEDFLRMPFDKMTEQQRFHSSPQYPHVVDESGCTDYLDHIGRLESIHDTCIWIESILGGVFKHKLDHLKKTEHVHYTEYYTESTKNLVFTKFRRDIEYFGYEFGS